MKKSRFKLICGIVLVAISCILLLSGCGNKLSSDFDEEEVKNAVKNVIAIINDKDAEALKNISTVRLKEAFTDEVINQIFEAIGEGGDFEEIEDMSVAGTVDKASEEEFATVVAKAKYDIKKFTFTITFTKQMKLTGLYLK